jgi:hypothetical protein
MNLPLQVGIPWRATEDRLGAFAEVVQFYEAIGMEVVTSDTREAQKAAQDGRSLPANVTFDPGGARNHLVRTMLRPSRVMILSDADTTPEVSSLLEAIQAVLDEPSNDHRLHLPYHLYHRIGQRTTGDMEYVYNATSGVLVFHPDLWHNLNGQDEMFHGWGWEDTAFALAHETLVGPIMKHRGVVTSRAHNPNNRQMQHLNRNRYHQYLAAYGDPAKMRMLTGTWQDAPGPAVELPPVTTTEIEGRPLGFNRSTYGH